MENWCPKEVTDWCISSDDTCALVESLLMALKPSNRKPQILIVGAGYTRLALGLCKMPAKYKVIVSDVDEEALRFQRLLMKSHNLTSGVVSCSIIYSHPARRCLSSSFP